MTDAPERKDTRLVLRIDHVTKATAMAEARRVRRSLSGWVELLIVEALERAKMGVGK